ncbi:MAG: hypothetical protein KAY24_08535 [Candidatus Eisenbacteria sp.]|nr:hypothetical protein [Candidatus Eisenbacteria bacterium]
MNRPRFTDVSLDQLSSLARLGDSQAETVLFEMLRVRLLDVAKRRVRRDDLEDVVQEALRIVHTKHATRAVGRGMLVWSMAVLRNVIGNYYQKREKLDRGEPFDERFHGTLDVSRARCHGIPGDNGPEGAAERILEAISLLARRNPRCGVLFRRIMESLAVGGSPREISQRAMDLLGQDFEEMSRSGLYVALHRCRNRLREILHERDRS